MKSKKTGVYILSSVIIVLFLMTLASAELQITKETVSSMAVKDLNLPAVYNLNLKNLGDADTFRIYSLVGINMEPNESFTLDAGSSKTIVLRAYPSIAIKSSPEYYSFEYKINGVNSGIQTDELAITIANLKDVFSMNFDDLTLDSDKAILTFANKGGYAFDNMNIEFSSAFFSETKTISMAASESKRLEFAIDKDKMSKLVAGPYIVNVKITYSSLTTSTSTILKFEEKPGITTTELSEGFLTKRYEIEKKNDGNVKTSVNVIIKKNLFESLFTSFNIPADRIETTGFEKSYLFQKDISPSESLKVVAKTQWWILLAIIVAIIIIWYIANKYIKNKIVLSKRVSYVRTKGGEFALKVSIAVKARDFVEKLRIVDRLPPMVKVFDKFSSIAPSKIDEHSRRLEWNLAALGKGEVREFSYIIYSKVGVVGKFELPSAMALYEYLGQMREANSNVAYYVSEPTARE